jgi:hypothetical protein
MCVSYNILLSILRTNNNNEHNCSFLGDIHQPLHASRTSDKGGNDITVQYHLLDNNNERRTTNDRYNYKTHVVLPTHHHHHQHTWNLHSIWDTALIETALLRNFTNKRSNMEKHLDQLLQEHPEWMERYGSCSKSNIMDIDNFYGFSATGRNWSCVNEWGEESWKLALKYAYTKNEPWKRQQHDDENNNDSVVEVVDGDVLDEDYFLTRLPIVEERLIAGGVRLAMTLNDVFREKKNIKDDEEEMSTKSSSIVDKSPTPVHHWMMDNVRLWFSLSEGLLQ